MNELPSKRNPRLNRIRLVSRIAKYISLIFLIWSVGFSCFSIAFTHAPAIKSNEWRAIPVILFTFVLWCWYWELSRLFHFYERGLIFAADSIRCIKILGLLWVIGWMLLGPLNSFLRHAPTSQTQPAVSSGNASNGNSPRIIAVRKFRMGFFSFNFGTNFDFGRLLEGVTIILIAWIMDEGRKIQEEQELTV